MDQRKSKLQRIAYSLVIITLGYLVLKHGKFILSPVTFALIFTVMLAPVSDFFERLVKFKIPAILLTLLSVTVVLGSIITLFSIQLTHIISELPQIEGNIITPNVVGRSVSINPLIALLALLLGGFIWGLIGIILAIPIVAVIKIFLEHKDRTKAVAALMSKKVHKQDSEFWKELDEDKYRIRP